MKDELKTKKELINELEELRQRIAELEKSEVERQRAEKALQESEKRYRQLFENVPVGLYRTTRDGEIVDVNPAMVQMLGYPDIESLKKVKTIGTYANPGDRIQWQKIMDRDGMVRNFQKQLCRRDGTIIWVEQNVKTFFNDDGENYYEGTFIDITERKRAEEALSESERRYRLLAENLTDIIWTSDLNLRLTYISPSVKRIRGYSVEEALIQTLEEILTPASLEVARKVLTEEMEIENLERKDLFRVRTIELEENCKDGSTVWTESTITFLRDGKRGPVGILGVTRDITERKRAEQKMAELQEQLFQSQKMEAIGQLAGGVAHDFNNLLTIIKGYSQLSLNELQGDSPVRSDVEEIKRAADRASDLTRQLLAFSRRQVMEVKVIDLNTILQNMDKMLRRLIGEDIELITHLEENLGRVKTDPGQIEQVVLNLVVNAKDVMRKGGKLIIKTDNVELDEESDRAHIGVKPGGYVMLSVSDTGVGMTPEVKERIFEPFFTTKEKGRGTGLGLSTVYGIVTQSGGNIKVYSELGKGTTFKVYLPRVDDPTDVYQINETTGEIPRGSETILVIEDEEEVRKVAAKILERLGYHVLEARHWSEALHLSLQYRELIHLILTDVILPEIDGPSLIEKLKEIHQGVKVLYMSGYAGDLIFHQSILEKETNFIQKPFSYEGLARKVRKVLDQ